MFRARRNLKVDLAELTDEKQLLLGFLRGSLGEGIVSENHNLLLDSEKLSAQDLSRLVNKFIYHRHLNNVYWVELDGNAVKIHRFKEKKSQKRKKHTTIPSTIKHGWL